MKNTISKIKAYFDPFITTALEDWLHLEKYLRIEQYKNRSVIKEADTVETKLRFILNGGGVLLINSGDKERCLDICLENDFLTDLNSLISGEPGKMFIKTFEEMKAVVIEREHLLHLYKASTFCSTVGRILAEQKANKIQEIQMSHVGILEHRYNMFIANTPDLLLRAPQRYVASYLGTSPQNLSRLRGKKKGEDINPENDSKSQPNE